MDIKDIKNNLNLLLQKKVDLEKQLTAAMIDVINKIAEENNPHEIKRLTSNIFIINSSELLGNPWNAEYFDWKASAKLLLEFLKSKPIENWKEVLVEKMNENKGKVVYIKKTSYVKGYQTINSIAIEKAFIEKIIKEL